MCTIFNRVFRIDNRLVRICTGPFRIDIQVLKIDDRVFRTVIGCLQFVIGCLKLTFECLELAIGCSEFALGSLEFVIAIKGLEFTIKDFRTEELCVGYFQLPEQNIKGHTLFIPKSYKVHVSVPSYCGTMSINAPSIIFIVAF